MMRLTDGTLFSMAVEPPKNGVSTCVVRFNKGGMISDTSFRATAEDLHKIRNVFEGYAMWMEDVVATGEEDPAPTLRCLPGGKDT